MPRKKPETGEISPHSMAPPKKTGRASKSTTEARKKPAAKGKRSPKPNPAPAVILGGESGEGAKAELEGLIKRYRGRPSKYEPRFCECVIAWGKLGKSRAWMAAEMMVTVKTMMSWAAGHEDFLSALETAKHLEQQWWEDKGQDCLTMTGFQAAAWSRSMAARFRDDWTERKDVNHGLSGEFAAFLTQIDGAGASLI